MTDPYRPPQASPGNAALPPPPSSRHFGWWTGWLLTWCFVGIAFRWGSDFFYQYTVTDAPRAGSPYRVLVGLPPGWGFNGWRLATLAMLLPALMLLAWGANRAYSATGWRACVVALTCLCCTFFAVGGGIRTPEGGHAIALVVLFSVALGLVHRWRPRAAWTDATGR